MFSQFNENIRQIYLATCLYDCIEDNNISAVELLLRDNGASPNIILPEKGITPFHLVIGSPIETISEEITKLFLQYGGNPNIRSEENMTPVHVAAAWGRRNLLDLLLKCGGDTTLQDEDGKTPLDYATNEGHWKVVTLLQDFNDNNLHETYGNYNLTLEKVIINHGNVIAEYEGTTSENNSEINVYNFLNPVSKNDVNSYVNNWCLKHTDLTQDISNLSNYYLKEQQKSETFIISARESSSFSDCNSNFKNIDTKSCDFKKEINTDTFIISKNSDIISDSSVNSKYKYFTENFVIKRPKRTFFNNLTENNCVNIEVNHEIAQCNKSSESEEDFSLISSEESHKETKNVSRESGILTIPSDSSYIFQNSLEQLNDCIIVNTLEPNLSKKSETSKYTTCDEITPLQNQKNYISNASVMTSDLSQDIITKHIFMKPNLNEIKTNAMMSDLHYKTTDALMTPDLTQIVMTSDSNQNMISSKLSQVKKKVCSDVKMTTESYFDVENTNISNIHATNVPCQVSMLVDSNNKTFVSVAEEYLYTDKKEGIVLIERRYLVAPTFNIEYNEGCSSSPNNTVSSLPTTIDYDTDSLRKELIFRGEDPGPIITSTKRVYLKKLMRLQKTPVEDLIPTDNCSRVYSVELEKTLRNPSWNESLTVYKDLESVMVNQFSKPDPSKRWREGITKASFTYLLIDPRVTNNLPTRHEKLDTEQTWRTFLSSVFYVGKGKRSRPYSHLYEAVLHWNNGSKTYPNKKTQHILEIWKDGQGVVCLHIFQNIIPVEAYTREAAMISAFKLKNLKNAKSGDFYGIVATWTQKQRRLLGVYLLYRAMLIFLNEGERQLRPDDIDK